MSEIQKLVDSFSAKISHPRGECFDASVSLGILLASQGFCTKLVKGLRGGVKHWWLKYHSAGGSLIIDPTAHQFDGDGEYLENEVHRMNFDSIAGYIFGEKNELVV